MAAVTEPILIEQGATFSQILDYLGGDLTGYQGRCEIRRLPNDAAAVISTTVVLTQIDPADPLGWQITSTLTATQTGTIPTTGKTHDDLERYIYDLEVYHAGGDVKRLVQGPAFVSPGSTK
jgi:hypothetical protein